MKEKTCCFTGHRNTGGDVRQALYNSIEEHITAYGVTVFYIGGYGNFDSMAKSVLQEMRKKYPNIEVYHVLAYMPGKTNEYDRKADENTMYPEGLELVPKRFAITHRNRWIVEQSDYIIAYVRTSYGGAYEALRYAVRKNKSIKNLAERECEN